MKKHTIFIYLILIPAIPEIQAQDYLIDFSATGDTNTVNTVIVDNLTSGASLTLTGGDVLHLSATVGLESPDVGTRSLQIYPNPMASLSAMTLVTPESGTAVISLVDLSGKTVFQTSTWLLPGTHSFRISGIAPGAYIVKATGDSYCYSAKLLSQSNLRCDPGIEYISSGTHARVNPLKSASATVDMLYNNGDQLLFEGTSGQFTTVFADVPVGSKTITFNFARCTDADSNHYAIVHIGAQTWMAENLNAGVRLDGVQEQTDNAVVEKYCYNNDESKCEIYGGLYQWDEMMQYVNQEGVRGICPGGWHIPSNGDWAVLITYLGGPGEAGGKMKSTGTLNNGSGLWQFPNYMATNEKGFTACPGGKRSGLGSFYSIGDFGYFWSSSEYMGTDALTWYVYYGLGNAEIINQYKKYGLSVRCVKNL